MAEDKNTFEMRCLWWERQIRFPSSDRSWCPCGWVWKNVCAPTSWRGAQPRSKNGFRIRE